MHSRTTGTEMEEPSELRNYPVTPCWLARDDLAAWPLPGGKDRVAAQLSGAPLTPDTF